MLIQEGVAQLPVTDDRRAVSMAQARAIPMVRTLIDLPHALTRLQEAGFSMPDEAVLTELLARDAEHKRHGAGPV